jgi:hypothetical protein
VPAAVVTKIDETFARPRSLFIRIGSQRTDEREGERLMKIFVIFDERGQIKGTVASAHDQMKIRSSAGTSVHIIENPEVAYKDVPQYLRDLHQNSRVDVSGATRIVRKRS